MNITEVRVKLVHDPSDKLLAFGSITINNEFVIRDLKNGKGVKGPIVAMPSRKLTDRCQRCGGKNHLRAGFCSECGARLRPDRATRDPQGRIKLHADIAHPINSSCREELQKKILDAYEKECASSKQDGYKANEVYEPDDIDVEYDGYEDHEHETGHEPKKDADGNFGDGIFI